MVWVPKMPWAKFGGSAVMIRGGSWRAWCHIVRRRLGGSVGRHRPRLPVAVRGSPRVVAEADMLVSGETVNVYRGSGGKSELLISSPRRGRAFPGTMTSESALQPRLLDEKVSGVILATGPRGRRRRHFHPPVWGLAMTNGRWTPSAAPFATCSSG
jgi:hypothetical protein